MGAWYSSPLRIKALPLQIGSTTLSVTEARQQYNQITRVITYPPTQYTLTQYSNLATPETL